MKPSIVLTLILCLALGHLNAQSCGSAQGNQTSYGTNNVWIGYVYTGMNFQNYQGYVTEGTAASSTFNETFGNSCSPVTYNTNGCSIQTQQFSVKYMLQQTFAAGTYAFTVGGDDGYRFSIDGGNTWVINQWQDQSYATSVYTVSLAAGNYNMVLEYYQNGGCNRVSFSVGPGCIPPNDNQTIYGTANQWIGYVYTGMNFNNYMGQVTEGTAASANFNETFGNSNTPITYNTSGCSIQTQQFSVHYRLQKYFYAGTYVFTVGGDDGYRFSLDGGNTWCINAWQDQSYASTTYTTTLTAGNYNMVLDYYQDGGANRVSFSASGGTLALTLVSFDGKLLSSGAVQLDWVSAFEVNNKYFEVQRSSDGINFAPIAQVPSKQSGPISSVQLDYSYIDNSPLSGKSYYKLKMVDLDGTVTYSKIIEITNSQTAGIKIYPTVINSSNNITIEANTALQNARMDLYDISGQKISETNWALLSGKQNLALGGNKNLAPGPYVVRISSNGSNVLSQLIIVQSN